VGPRPSADGTLIHLPLPPLLDWHGWPGWVRMAAAFVAGTRVSVCARTGLSHVLLCCAGTTWRVWSSTTKSRA
jgi:hypothetical protein